jgi:hypothetical protein
METSNTNPAASNPSADLETSLGARVWRMLTLGNRLGRRTAVVVWIAAAVGLGLFVGWGWLVAAGLSSTVLALLPCAAMCALGLCGGSGKKCSDNAERGAPPEPGP